MSRLRNVGRQAAGADDIISKKDLDAFAATLSSIYITRSLFNQPSGVAQLDVNGRMENAQLPTAISRTTLTSSGATNAGSLAVTNNATVGGTLTVTGAAQTGALTAPSANVSGAVTAGTINTAQNTAATFEANAMTVDSLTTAGSVNALDINATGNLDVDGTANTGALTATSVDSSGTIHAVGDITSDAAINGASAAISGAVSVNGLTNAGTSNFSGTGDHTFAGKIRANLGLRIGNGQAINQVDAGGANVPVVLTGGISTSGPLSGATNISNSGTTTTTGKGTFGDLQSLAGLQIAGALSGVTTMTLAGDLTVNGAGKKIITPDLNTNTMLCYGTSTGAAGGTATPAHFGSVAAATDTHLMLNGKFLRNNGARLETWHPTQSKWAPHLAVATCGITRSTNQVIANNTDTLVLFDGLMDADYTTILNSPQSGRITVYLPGWYQLECKVTMSMLQDRGCSLVLRKNNVDIPETAHEDRAANMTFDDLAGADAWGYVSMYTTVKIKLAVNDYITAMVWQATGFNSDLKGSNSLWKSHLRVTYLGAV